MWTIIENSKFAVNQVSDTYLPISSIRYNSVTPTQLLAWQQNYISL